MLKQMHMPTLSSVLLNPLSRDTYPVAKLNAEPSLLTRKGFPSVFRSRVESCFEIAFTLLDPTILLTRKLATMYESRKENSGTTTRMVAPAFARGPACLNSATFCQDP